MVEMVSNNRTRYAFFVLLLATLWAPPLSFSKDFGSLISPGDLSSLHREVDGLSNCTKCHSVAGGITNENCTSCHKDIGGAKKGFHFQVAQEKCIKCHPDHKGRSYNMIEWNPKEFDHSKTGYSLAGMHQKPACEKCHMKRTKNGFSTFLGTETACKGCHEDVHKGTLKDSCETCHNANGWKGKEVSFDHNKSYKLDGKHVQVKCEKCHLVKGMFRIEEKDKCITCHKKDDKHKGSLGTACEKCHQTASWKQILFDHSKTKYSLLGKHLKVGCEKCHVDRAKGQFKIAKYDTCDAPGCHDKGKFGNVHEQQFVSVRCDKCHTLEGFKPALFKHENEEYRGFKLKGKHAQVTCEKCHRQNQVTKVFLYKPIETSSCDSTGCHDVKARGKVHGNQFKGQRCESCHTEQGWKPTTYNHNAEGYAGFRLKGKHSKVECQKCHRMDPMQQATLYKPIESGTCNATGCHDVRERGNIHGAQFKGQRCESCHNEQGWKPSGFDHKAEGYVGYRLEGKHASLKCEKCHMPDPATSAVLYKPIDTKSCDTPGCHDVRERGNIHGAQFKGRNCTECHTIEGWKPSRFDHNSTAYKGYKLEGRHAHLKCDKCHAAGANEIALYKPIDTRNCASSNCHKDPHEGLFFDKRCEQCHTVKGWKGKELTFNHNLQSKFPLEGKHVAAACEKCHQNKVWKRIKDDCLSCHQRDDDRAHRGRMGAKCEQCHTTQSWEPKSFFHETTGFVLEGAHTQISCRQCHTTKGVYTGLGTECTKCHTDPHWNQFGPEACTDCHTAKNWYPERFRHAQTGFRLEGGHRATACEKCHTNRWYRNVPYDCYFCHTRDFTSPAGAAYHTSGNTNCLMCHTVYTWLGANFTHASMTFTGAHAAIKGQCTKCHTTSGSTFVNKWPGVTSETQCYGCHATTYATKHSTCPTDCTLCHTTTTWRGAVSVVQCR